MYMMNAIVYNKDGFWFVDYIDSNYELLPAVGIFKYEEDARAAAKTWNDQTCLETMGKSDR